MKKYFTGLFFSLAVLFISSCSDWLNVQPKTTVEEDKVFNRELGFKEALTGVYLKMASTGLYARNLSYGFLDILGQRYQGSSDDVYQNELWYTFPSLKTEVYTEAIWAQMYNVIANVNNIILYADLKREVFITENYYEIIKGEALALRAFLHFDLLRMYGPVYKDNNTAKRIVYRTKFNKNQQELQSSNVVLDSIIADLKLAEALLKNSDPLNFEFPMSQWNEEDMEGDKFLVYRHKRMNLYAVKAMLARVYLYIGNNQEAVNYATQVIESKQFELLANTADILRSKEVIFSVYIDKFDQQVAQAFDISGSYYISKKGFLEEMFDVALDGTNDFRIREGVSFDYASNGVASRKYRQENMWVSMQNTVVLIRLAEMYYILAECAQDPETASGFLSKVREVRGIDPVVCTAENLIREIEKEYRKEFYGEGQLFFFYKRHGYTSFLHNPVKQMTESNYMFSWPDNEVLFGMTN